VGAVIVCCIFIASSTSTGAPALTSSPSATATETTEPGIGASSEPLATASAGSTKRGTSRRRADPSALSTYTKPGEPGTSPDECPRVCEVRKRAVTPPTSRTTSSGEAESTRTSGSVEE
jgi:hypothetical protein